MSTGSNAHEAMPGEIDLAKQIALLAREFSTQFSGLRQQLVRFRPAICPFDEIFKSIRSGVSAFDIGCGSGFMLFAIGRLRAPQLLVGVDANAALISATTESLAKTLPGVPVKLMATPSFSDWPDVQFDVVTLIDVLHHVPVQFQADFVRAAAARVAPGGVLIYKDMASKPLIYGFANRLHDLVLAKQWINYVPIDEVSKTLAESGFVESSRMEKKMFCYAHQMIVMTRV